jgi:hypothetical protein
MDAIKTTLGAATGATHYAFPRHCDRPPTKPNVSEHVRPWGLAKSTQQGEESENKRDNSQNRKNASLSLVGFRLGRFSRFVRPEQRQFPAPEARIACKTFATPFTRSNGALERGVKKGKLDAVMGLLRATGHDNGADVGFGV